MTITTLKTLFLIKKLCNFLPNNRLATQSILSFSIEKICFHLGTLTLTLEFLLPYRLHKCRFVMSVTGTSGTAILRLGHVQKFCQKF